MDWLSGVGIETIHRLTPAGLRSEETFCRHSEMSTERPAAVVCDAFFDVVDSKQGGHLRAKRAIDLDLEATACLTACDDLV